MGRRSFIFAGGGTGGHIYPAIAVAEKIARLKPDATIQFLCSSRAIDSQILSKTRFAYITLPARGFSIRPLQFFDFFSKFLASSRLAKDKLADDENATVVGVGGFVSVPVCWAAHRLALPIHLINVDTVPGKANKLTARWARQVFVQFEGTVEYFAGRGVRTTVVGCPLRSSFENPEPQKAKVRLHLDPKKKTLLVTGASSGSERINRTICALLDKLNTFVGEWQIVHLAGAANYEDVQDAYSGARVSHRVLDYYDDMADLLAAADLVIGRSGAVSVAEYAATGVPSICMPYPFHKDMHQYLNAGKLVEAGAAVVVDDLPDEKDRCEWLWEELEPLLRDEAKRAAMKQACESVAKIDAALNIAEMLLEWW